MRPLPIVWQRLVGPDGKTCDRCNATQQEMRRALGKLKAALIAAAQLLGAPTEAGVPRSQRRCC